MKKTTILSLLILSALISPGLVFGQTESTTPPAPEISPAPAVETAPAPEPPQPVATPAPVEPSQPVASSTSEEEVPLELMVFQDIMIATATKRMQKISEIPGNVTIITGDELREKGALTLSEALFHLTGIYFDNSSVVTVSRMHGIATMQNGNILLLMNGRKINIPEWGQVDNDFGINNLDNVKRIEIIKGPGSALYGANAFAGIINVITYEGKDIGGARVKSGVGHINRGGDLSQYYLVTYGEQSGDWDYFVDASYWRQFSNLEREDVELNNVLEGNNAAASLKYKKDWSLYAGYNKMRAPLISSSYMEHGITDWYLMTNYSYPLDDISKLSVHLEDTYYNKYYPGTQASMKQTRIKSRSDVPSDATTIINFMGFMYPIPDDITGFYMDLEGYNNLLAFYIQPAAQKQVMLGGTMNGAIAELQYDLGWPENNYLIAGINFRYDQVNYNSLVKDVVSDKNYAFFLQDEYHLLDNLILLAGGRYDYNSDYGSNINPKASLIYKPLSDLNLKLLYGTAFREPSLYERYSYPANSFPDAPELKPEKLTQYEVNLEYQTSQWLQAKASYYYAETKDEITMGFANAPLYVYAPDLSLINPFFPPVAGLYASPFPAFVWSWVNTNQYIYRGFELENTIRPIEYVYLQWNYSRPVLYQVDNPAPEQDVNLINATLGLKYEMLFANLYYHSMRMPTAVTNPNGEYYNEYRWTKRYDVSVGGRYENLSLTAILYNILDEWMYYYANAKEFEHRSWRLLLEYTFKF